MKNKLVGILIISIILIVAMASTAFAAKYGGINTNISIGGTAAASSSAITGRILRTLQVAGTVISVAALIIIGMRYMLSSVEGKAQMKGVIGYYIIGCVLVFATTNVMKWVYDIINGL